MATTTRASPEAQPGLRGADVPYTMLQNHSLKEETA
jgi:hypothetical protein